MSEIATPVSNAGAHLRPAHDRCAACEEPLGGRFCATCGERRPSPDDERLGPFLREQWQEATAADGKLWATVKALFVPGKLTEEYFAGRRGRYVRPVRIFLVANVAFFLTLSVMGGTSSFLGAAEVQRGDSPYSSWATDRLALAADDAGVSQAVYDAAFDKRSATLATSLVGLMVPALALVLGVVLFRRRASGVRHLVFATHFLAFAMAGTIVVGVVWIPLIMAIRVAEWVPEGHWVTYSMDPAVMVLLLVYLALALRRVYTMRWRGVLLSTAVIVGAGIPVVTMGYRFALFVVALWTTDIPTV